MKFTFYKGEHRGSPKYWLHWFPLLFFRKRIIREIVLTQDSKYDLPDENDSDQEDTNKLFGVASISGIHKDSIRVGYFYAKDLGVFILKWYIYNNGVRSDGKLTVVAPGEVVYAQITLRRHGVVNFKVWRAFAGLGQESCSIDQKRGKISFISMLLGPYFGGNFPAPHNVIVYLKKVSRKYLR